MILSYLDVDDPYKNGLNFEGYINNPSKLTPLNNSELFSKLEREAGHYKNLKISAIYLFDSDEHAALTSNKFFDGKEHSSLFLNRKILELPDEQFNFILHHEFGHVLNKNGQAVSSALAIVLKGASMISMASAFTSFSASIATSAINIIFDTGISFDSSLMDLAGSSALYSAASFVAANLTYRYKELFCDKNGYEHTKIPEFTDASKVIPNWNDKAFFKEKGIVNKLVDGLGFILTSNHPFTFERKLFIKALNALDKVPGFVEKLAYAKNDVVNSLIR